MKITDVSHPKPQHISGNQEQETATAAAEAAKKKQAVETKVTDLVGLSGVNPKLPVHDPEAVSSQRVDELREQVKAGKYHVPGVAIARKMLALLKQD